MVGQQLHSAPPSACPPHTPSSLLPRTAAPSCPVLLQAEAEARERLSWRLEVLTGTLSQLLGHVFGLLGRLSEVSEDDW